MKIAALYVQTGGCYFDLPDVDPWDEPRDARSYSDRLPVVAHPPCERWGRYWYGGPSCHPRKILGDDGGCFASALANVRRVGGVLEHPEASHAWAHHGLARPPRGGGWIKADDFGGWTCCVEQGYYGHRARKATWLYAVGCVLPELRWGRAPGNFLRLDEGFNSKEQADRVRADRRVRGVRSGVERLGKRERAATPREFRDLLISIAQSACK